MDWLLDLRGVKNEVGGSKTALHSRLALPRCRSGLTVRLPQLRASPLVLPGAVNERRCQKTISASSSTWSGLDTVGSRMSSSTPAAAYASIAPLIDSGDRSALPATISAISLPIGW